MFVAVVYFIVKRHRQRFARHEVTAARTGSVEPSNERKDIQRIFIMGLGRTEKHHVAIVCMILRERVLVQGPPPAYIPLRRGLPWHREMAGEYRGSIYSPSLKHISSPRRG